MRPTRVWRTIAAVAGGLILVAAITFSLTPAAIGLATIVYLAHTRWSARRAFRETDVRVSREIAADTIHRGSPFEVVLDAEASRLSRGVRLRVEDDPPDAFPLRQGDAGLHEATRRTYVVEPQASGSFAFEQVQVRLEDGRGLWHHEATIPLQTETRVLPSRERLLAGRRLAKRSPIEAKVDDPRGTVVKELEFESVRPFEPADRLRDVDWKRFAKFEELMTRQFEKEREAPVVFLVDASRTMRQVDADGDTKLDFASGLVLELAEAASSHGNAVGLVAFDELRVLETHQPSSRREAPTRLAELVSELPGRVRARRRLDVGLAGDSSVDERELDVLDRLALLRGAEGSGDRPPESSPPASPGFTEAVRRILASGTASRTAVVTMTDLEGFPDEAVRLLGRLASRGHQVVVGVLPGTWFLDPPDRIRPRDLENAYKEIQTRRRTRRMLQPRGIPVLELGPWSTAAVVAEQTRGSPERSRIRGQGPEGERGGRSTSPGPRPPKEAKTDGSAEEGASGESDAEDTSRGDSA